MKEVLRAQSADGDFHLVRIDEATMCIRRTQARENGALLAKIVPRGEVGALSALEVFLSRASLLRIMKYPKLLISHLASRRSGG